MATKKRKPNVTAQLQAIINGCGLTRYELCKLTGSDKAALSRFMAGERSLTLDSVDRLAELLGLELTATALPERAKGR